MQRPPPPGLPMRHRRRPPTLNAGGPILSDPASTPAAPPLKLTARRAVGALIPLFAVALLLHSFLNLHQSLSPPPPLAAASLPSPDDEASIADFRVPASADPPATDGLITCMPTVARANGSIEYVSNAAKSWWLAFGGSPPPLRVFEMGAGAEGTLSPAWLASVGGGGRADGSGWLRVRRLKGQARLPRRQTFNDSLERVAWRSKEAQDYAAVLRACVRAAKAVDESEVLIVQDDVLFTRGFVGAQGWARGVLADGARTRVNANGVRRPVSVCSASFFDLGGKGDEKLHTSNLVARVWKIEEAVRVADYIDNRFDHMPVDWLTDHWCRKHHGIVAVFRPNPVRHRGKVSSFSQNKREGTLT